MSQNFSARAAVALIFTEKEKRLLIVKRSEHPDDPWSGHLALPGGKSESCDSDLLDTCIRETREECGIELKRNDCIETMPVQLAGHYAATDPMAVQPYVFCIPQEPLKITLDRDELSEYYWVSREYLCAMSNHRKEVQASAQSKTPFPCILIGDTLLWGFTYNVLHAYFSWAEID